MTGKFKSTIVAITGVIVCCAPLSNETSFTPNPVTIIAGASDLRSFIGTSEVKVVFVNVAGLNRTLCHVDFNRTSPCLHEYLDDRNVYTPTISPDGRYVAYCSNNEGQAGPSRISIRSLDAVNTPILRLSPDTAYLPRWWIDPSTGDTCIVYTNSGVDNEHPLWPATKTFLQTISSGRPVAGGLRELISDGSYHGGLSVKGQYAVTGYRRLLIKDVWTDTGEQQLFLSPRNGKDSRGSTQVCNVSMSPDTGSGARCLFLDFGYPWTSTVTNCSYGVHQFLFVSSMDGAVTNFIPYPRFAVGCGMSGADQAHAIYAIDLESRISERIITGTELQQPCLQAGAL
jgi:hypothetical protein